MKDLREPIEKMLNTPTALKANNKIPEHFIKEIVVAVFNYEDGFIHLSIYVDLDYSLADSREKYVPAACWFVLEESLPPILKLFPFRYVDVVYKAYEYGTKKLLYNDNATVWLRI